MKKREKINKNGWKTLLRILSYIWKGYKWQCLAVLACILLSNYAIVRCVWFMRDLVDVYILPMLESGSRDFAPLALAIVQIALVGAAGTGAAYIHTRLMVDICQGVMEEIRNTLFAHMQDLPIGYFDSHAHGDIMSVYTNDVDTLRHMIDQSLPQMVNSLVSVLMAFTGLLMLDGWLTLLCVGMVVLMMLITTGLGAMSGRFFAQAQGSLGEANGYIEEVLEGQKVVKVFCREQPSIQAFEEINERLRVSATKANSIVNSLMPINGNLSNLTYVLCAIAGGLLALQPGYGLTLGSLVAFLTMSRNFTQPVMQVSQQLNSLIMAIAGGERIFLLMDEAKEADQGYVELVHVREEADGSLAECRERCNRWAWKHYHKDSQSTTLVPLEGGIVMDGVDFGYTEEKQVLYGIRLEAMPGQKIAFVGGTGAGKTTITNLINRFYDIQDGKIRYDGININKIKKNHLRRSLGMVLQDTHLFTGTVMENIRYGRLEATDEECIQAAKMANAHGFIRRLPDGYQTQLVGAGANFSQGERQLLAIARAAVADPPVLILDEATSSIDTRTEKLVQQGMDALMKGRTTFVIAHRLSTVRNADCIMVLDQGRIIERGTHAQLLEKKGKYYQLYTGSLHTAAPAV